MHVREKYLGNTSENTYLLLHKADESSILSPYTYFLKVNEVPAGSKGMSCILANHSVPAHHCYTNKNPRIANPSGLGSSLLRYYRSSEKRNIQESLDCQPPGLEVKFAEVLAV